MSYDAYNDPYARKLNAKIKRTKFEKLKKSKSFILWKTRQNKIQEGLCAYCRIPLYHKDIITHIDHVTPLYYDGTNDYKNFVLCCKRCNLQKWVNDRYVIPQWIRDNDEKLKTKQRLNAIRKKQEKQMRELLDEQIYKEILRQIN